MAGLIVRTLISALGLWVASRLVSGISVSDTETLLLAALLLGIVNAIVRPIAVLLTLPVTLLTLGLFLWVINAAMLGLVAWLLDGVQIAGFGSALIGAILVSLTGWVANSFVGASGGFELVVKKG